MPRLNPDEAPRIILLSRNEFHRVPGGVGAFIVPSAKQEVPVRDVATHYRSCAGIQRMLAQGRHTIYALEAALAVKP